ncbi:MAG: endonuclease III [Clostridiales bacterium]|jgi:endonuclease-3|nr:endonuclease III [Clostridiales bacterium]
MKKTKKKEAAKKAIEALKQRYPDAVCSLEYGDALQLLISTRLSAQCTDARVNMVTPALFERFPDLDSFADADVGEVEELIRSCGLYKTKARDIVAMAKMLRDMYGGVIPDTVEELIKLPGVGRKTANLVVGDVYGKPAVVADTHCIRISNRLGLCDTKDAKKVEQQLREILPPEESNAFCHRLVLFGREICSARSPKCDICPLNKVCPSADI